VSERAFIRGLIWAGVGIAIVAATFGFMIGRLL
jgi:hypothetical protein